MPERPIQEQFNGATNIVGGARVKDLRGLKDEELKSSFVHWEYVYGIQKGSGGYKEEPQQVSALEALWKVPHRMGSRKH